MLAAARRDAFVPTLFACRGQQPMAFAAGLSRRSPQATSPDRLWACASSAARPLDPADRATLARYDYIVFAGVRPFALADRARPGAGFLAPRFQLYRVARLTLGAPFSSIARTRLPMRDLP